MLLQLADSPADKTRVEDLALLDRPTAPESLTWADILRDDPLDNRDGTWDDVHFGGASSESGEGSSLLQDSDNEGSRLSDSVFSVEDPEKPFRSNGLSPDFEMLQTIRESRDRFIKTSTNSDPLTETQIIRGIIFMLHGLRSTLFKRLEDGRIQPRLEITIQDLAAATSSSTIQTSCDIGSTLSTIRDFTAKAEAGQVLQTLQSCLVSRLREVDLNLSEIEQRVIKGFGSPATLAALLPEIDGMTSHIMLFKRVIPSEATDNEKKCIFALEALHQLACEQQAMGDLDGSGLTAEVFFDCFQTYLKPLEEWMQEGTLNEYGGSLFIRRSPEALPLSSLWSKQYSLIRDEHDKILAPSFLQSFAPTIFASGKAVNFSKALGETSKAIEPISKSPLTFATVCDPSLNTISPFEELFARSLQQWVEDRRSLSSIHLKARLSSKYNLYHALDALNHIYFGCNGSFTQHIARGIFDRIDRGKRWQDRFALTDLFRDGLNSVTCVEEVKLSVRITETSKLQETKPRSILQLECLRINYELPWPLATIVRPESFPIYQRIAVLLFQLLRAKNLLNHQSFQIVFAQKPTDIQKYGLSIRHRLHWFVETVQNYILKEVLEPTMLGMRSEMSSAPDIDSMICLHENHLAQAEIACLLANQQRSTHQALVSILDIVIVFSDLCSASIFSSSATKNSSHFDSGSSEENDEKPTRSQEQGLESPNALRAKLIKISTTYTRLLNFVFMGARDAGRNHKGSTLQKLVDLLKFGIKDP